MHFGRKKPNFLGAVNGMIVGLVAITPAAGYVNGWGALCIGVIVSSLVWLGFNKLSRFWPFSKVDDALGVVYTHGLAGLVGGLLVGVFADPKMIVYLWAKDPAGGREPSTATRASCGSSSSRPSRSSSGTAPSRSSS